MSSPYINNENVEKIKEDGLIAITFLHHMMSVDGDNSPLYEDVQLRIASYLYNEIGGRRCNS